MGCRHAWVRFFCPREGSIRLDPDGYPIDLRGEYGRTLQPDCISLSEALQRPCAVILGEAGIGKSDVMGVLAQTLRQEAGDERVTALDLGMFSDPGELARDLFDSDRFREWLAGSDCLYLVLDGLDEAIAGVQNIVGLLERRLRDLPFDRLRVCVSCRTAAWPETLTEHIMAQYGGSDAVGIYEVVPLLRADIALAAQARRFDPDLFLHTVADRGAQGLASNPLSLRLLLELFGQAGGLPASRAELFERGLACLCEPSRERQARTTASPYTKEQLLEVATRLAALTVLTGRAAIYTGPDTGAAHAGTPLNEFVGGTDGNDPGRVDVTEPAIRQSLYTGLFTGRGPELFGFAHKSYAEFLAARYLGRSGLSAVQCDSLLSLADERPPRLVPQLHETAAWLASIDRQFFEKVLTEEPEVLLLSDVPGQDDATKARIIDGLLNRIDAGHLSYHQRLALQPFLGRLSHDGIAAQLQAVITDANKSDDTRATAVNLAVACHVQSLGDDLADLALDTSTGFELRVNAGYAVCNLALPDACAKLKPLAFSDAASDPDDQLHGLALQACWPAHMIAEELFRALTPPRRRNFHGSYRRFLWDSTIAQQLQPADLPGALAWAEKFHARDPDHDDLSRLAAQIITLAWKHMREPGVLEPLARVVFELYREHGCPFYIPAEDDSRFLRNDLTAINRMIQEDTESRRLLVETIVELAKEEDQEHIRRLAFSNCALVRREDFPWLLQRACGSDEAEARLWTELAWARFDWSKSANVDLWLDARERSSIVAGVMNCPLQVVIDSEQGRKQKAAHLEMKRWERTEEQPQAPERPPAERVRLVLERCLTDKPDGFWWLVQQMTLEPSTTHYPLSPADIRTSPGWKEADEATRRRIVQAAARYLETIPADSNEFLGRAHTYTDSDLAAPQAMVLLLHEDRVALESLHAQIWRGWAANVLVRFAGVFNCDEGDKQAICALLHQHAADEARVSILALIEQERSGSSSPSVIHVWEEHLDQELAATLVDRVSDTSFSPSALAGVIGWLLRHGIRKANEFVEAILTVSPPADGAARARSIAVAVVAIQHAVQRFWPLVWSAMRGDQLWGRQVIERVSSRHLHDGRQFVTSLSDEACGDLLAWMLRQYPPETDPERQGAYSPTGQDEARRFRGELMNYLQSRGTNGACEALRRLRDENPQYSWLNDVLLDAQAARRRQTWSPPTPSELRRLVQNRRARYVSGPADLLNVLCESLDRLVEKLQGELPARRDLWDLVGTSPQQRWRPTEEEHLSDYVARHFCDDLGAAGVIVNREVQIRRRAVSKAMGGVAGQKTDLKVDAVRPGAGRDDADTLSVIVEVKGCWHREVRDAQRNQLVERYLRATRCRHGLYVVGWFTSPAWDSSDDRRRRVPWTTIDEARVELGVQAEGLSGTADADEVRAYVLDCSLP